VDRASDLRSTGSRVRSPATTWLRNDSGQVVHTHVPRRRLSSLLYEVVKQGSFTFTMNRTELNRTSVRERQCVRPHCNAPVEN